ncbi:WEB family protein, partial [Trifolium medium]|nr:WEB family protein [Trifolium medium]
KSSELQTQLNAAQEDLKKAKEQLVKAEKEKENAINELKEAQRLSEEANEKLREAMVAQKRAEDDSEIEKFRAVELEQAGIEAAQKKEEQWQRELESVRNQHALDVSALLTTTQELQRVKQELLMTSDAKNQALSHADDATKIAEIHAEKVEILSAELIRLKGLLDSKLETEASENKIVSELQT